MSITRKLVFPRPELRSYIECYQYFEVDSEFDCNAVMIDYPRTALDIVFVFGGGVNIEPLNNVDISLPKYSLLGLFDRKYTVKYTNGFQGIHVRFKPNGIYPITSIPLKHSWKRQMCLEDLIGGEIRHVYDNMGNESQLATRIDLLEGFLIKKYDETRLHPKFDYCLDVIDKRKNQINVEQLAYAVNSNYKSLDRWFKKYVGTSPKKYLQLNRFKNVLQSMDAQTQIDWMQLVVDGGFHDQSHFINYFKKIAGVTPTEYIMGQKPSLSP